MRRTLVVASAILATLLTMPLSMAAVSQVSAAAPTDSGRASQALSYLLAAQKTDGSIDGSISETADFVIGTAAAGYDPSTLTGCSGTTSALSYLAGASDAAATNAGKTGKTILAVVAAGGNPASFAGRDLSARLAALYHSATGAYGDGSTFGQSLAILAVVASGGSVPAEASAELAALQGTDGGWTYSAAKEAGDGDSNDTAIALMALHAAGVHSADSTGLAYLHTQQNTDGGFLFSSAYGPPADPDSDSIVIEALVAEGQNPEAAGWSQGSNNAMTHLRASQGSDGGFAYPGSPENAFTTTQVPAALVRVPYGAAVHFAPGASVPTTNCPAAPVPSASAAASTSASASPSATASTSAGASPSATASLTRTPPPTSTGSDPSQPGNSAPPLAALICVSFGALGLAAVTARRGIGKLSPGNHECDANGRR
ncbi:MAG TPA: hypothetical protein VF375_03290 [Candidatus Limnocylindrales bacterium]